MNNDTLTIQATDDPCPRGSSGLFAWPSGPDAWELNANLDWLKTYVTP